MCVVCVCSVLILSFFCFYVCVLSQKKQTKTKANKNYTQAPAASLNANLLISFGGSKSLISLILNLLLNSLIIGLKSFKKQTTEGLLNID